MSQKKLIVILFGLVALTIIFSALVILLQFKKTIVNEPIEAIPAIINNTNNEVNNIKDVDSIKEELATTTDPTLFRGVEDRGILINFKDGYEMPTVPDDPDDIIKAFRDTVLFGPRSDDEYAIRHEIPVRPYVLRIIPHRDLAKIMLAVRAEGLRSEEPAVININGLEGLEYSTIGICEGRNIEIVGKSYNYHFEYNNCGSSDDNDKRNYLIETIKTIQLVK